MDFLAAKSETRKADTAFWESEHFWARTGPRASPWKAVAPCPPARSLSRSGGSWLLCPGFSWQLCLYLGAPALPFLGVFSRARGAQGPAPAFMSLLDAHPLGRQGRKGPMVSPGSSARPAAAGGGHGALRARRGHQGPRWGGRAGQGREGAPEERGGPQGSLTAGLRVPGAPGGPGPAARWPSGADSPRAAPCGVRADRLPWDGAALGASVSRAQSQRWPSGPRWTPHKKHMEWFHVTGISSCREGCVSTICTGEKADAL